MPYCSQRLKFILNWRSLEKIFEAVSGDYAIYPYLNSSHYLRRVLPDRHLALVIVAAQSTLSIQEHHFERVCPRQHSNCREDRD